MRLRACLALVCLMLAGCEHLPDQVRVDLDNRTVSVGPCRCDLPVGKAPPGNSASTGAVSGRADDSAPE